MLVKEPLKGIDPKEGPLTVNSPSLWCFCSEAPHVADWGWGNRTVPLDLGVSAPSLLAVPGAPQQPWQKYRSLCRRGARHGPPADFTVGVLACSCSSLSASQGSSHLVFLRGSRWRCEVVFFHSAVNLSSSPFHGACRD